MYNIYQKNVEMLLKAITMNATYAPRFKGTTNISMLKNIVLQGANLKHGLIFQSDFWPFLNLRLASFVPFTSKFSCHHLLLHIHFVKYPVSFKTLTWFHIPSAKTHTFYYFRKGGEKIVKGSATFSFNNNMAFQDICLQGS